MAYKQNDNHDKFAQRREQLLTEKVRLNSDFKREKAEAVAELEKIKTLFEAAQRGLNDCEAAHTRAIRNLNRDLERVERQLRESPNGEIDTLLDEVDTLEQKIMRSSVLQSGEDAPVRRIRHLRREIENLKFEPSNNVAKKLAALRAKLPTEAEAVRSWPPVPQEVIKAQQEQELMGAVWGGRHRRQGEVETF